jgi:hypothetical protein
VRFGLELKMRFLVSAIFIFSASGFAADEAADLRLRISPNEVLNYVWSISSISDSSGVEKGRKFMLSADSTFGMILMLRGMPIPPGKKKDSAPVSIRIKDQTYLDKRSIEDSKTELYIAKGKMKYTENGKVMIDSDNDIGLDKMGMYQDHFKKMEGSEMRATLDQAGRQSEVLGDEALVQSIKNSGAQGIFPILSGKETKVGESWEESFTMPQIGEFKLAKPLTVRSKMTFAKWIEKDGKKLAQIDLATSWESQDLRGENDSGMLVEITKVFGAGSGRCLFEPASGRFIDGLIDFSMKYRIDGEKAGDKSGLDVSGKTKFTFTAK